MESSSKKAESSLCLVNTTTSANWIDCALCRQKYRAAAITAAGTCYPCHDRQRRRSDRLREILSNRALKEHTLERFQVNDENREAFEVVQSFDPLKDSLYLWGSCGVGKSHLASLIIREAIACDLLSIIQTEPSQMLRDINSALHQSAEAEERAINRFAKVSLLVLDDFGTEKITDYKLEKLFEVINGRDKAMKAGLVITSNYSVGQISSRLNDDRIVSRIAGLCRFVKVGGQDWRLVK
jgi:DNA replication protein DnaC